MKEHLKGREEGYNAGYGIALNELEKGVHKELKEVDGGTSMLQAGEEYALIKVLKEIKRLRDCIGKAK